MGRKLNGFTLAEVLITLVIIGVIAAMTIPTLMNNTNEQELIVATKKAYSVFSQVYQRMFADNGEIYPQTLGSSNAEATKSLGDMFAKYLNTQKVCGQANGDCWSSQNGGVYKYFDGRDWYNWNGSNQWYVMRLNDGMSVGVYGYFQYFEAGNSELLKYIFGQIFVDVNGDKGPNTLGKDVFTFRISKYGVVPVGSPEDSSATLDTCVTDGETCTAWVVTKGNMDYLHKDVSW